MTLGRLCETDARPLGGGEIALVLAPYDAPAASIPALAALLTPAERATAARHAAPAAQDRAIAARGMLRLLLARHLGRPPEPLAIDTDETGKPFVRDRDAAGRPVFFNLAHAGDLVLYAFARAAVGVDIEPIRPMPRLDAFVRMTFGPRERAIHATLADDKRVAHAYRIWVGKEALVKRTGEGIRRDFSSFDLTDEDATIFVPQDGYVAAVAGTTRAILRLRRVADLATLL